MSSEKAIKYKKEKRKQYYDSRAVDSSCRNHGSCKTCKSNRLISSKKAKIAADSQIKEWKKEK